MGPVVGVNRHPAAYVVAEEDLTEYDCAPNEPLDEADARLRPDPWGCEAVAVPRVHLPIPTDPPF